MGNLVSLTDVKQFMQITGTVSDAILDVYIALTEAEIEAVLDRNLARATYTEVVDYLQSKFDHSAYTNLDAGPDRPRLFLKNTPVVTISSVVSGGVTMSSSHYTYDPDNGVFTPETQLDVPTVTYVAGYTTATLPAALKGVIEAGVSSLYYNNQSSNQSAGNVKAKRIKDFSVDYGNDQTGYVASTLSGGEKQLVKTYIASNMVVLNRYRNVNL